MKTNSLFFIIFLFYFLSLSFPSNSEKCNPQDKKVLLKIKQDLGNPYHLASWNPDTDCCDWYVVDCDPKTNRINALTVFQANISGQIPASVGDLPYLETLLFRHITNLTGQIPSAIAKLTRLTTVRLSWTNLTGPVPSFFSKLKTLTYLDLSFNQLSGSIPPSLSLLPNLSGQIPASVGDLPYLETLLFRHITNLTGEIPSAIAKLTRLRMVRLSWTNLTGPVPSFFSKLPALYYLDLSFNQLSGSIPPSLSLLPNLLALHLDRNKLTGTIPESFGAFTGSSPPDLFLSHNQLTGSVPKSLGKLNFSTLDFSRNRLTGDISFLFGKSKALQDADFSRNLFEFDITKLEFPESLNALDWNHNKLKGNVPVALTTLANLQRFNVSYNRLCGQIPVGGKLQSFTYAEYFHNRCLCGAPLPAC